MTDEDEIFQYLSERLDQVAEQQYAGSRLPAVRIQIEQARLRLERFATVQAQRRREGWRIVSTEESLIHEFEVDGQPFLITGKIDRVDQHESTGQVAVWTISHLTLVIRPEKAHVVKQQWKDLQLPLYRHLVKEISAVTDANLGNMITGFILLPKALDKVGFYEAEWDVEKLESADETAQQVIRDLRSAKFWPPAEHPPEYSEDLAAICMDNVFEMSAFAPAPMEARFEN